MNKEKQLDELFEQARSQAPNTSFDAAKMQFLKSMDALSSKKTLQMRKIFTSKIKIIMSISIFISALITSIFIWLNSKDTKHTMDKLPENQSTEKTQQEKSVEKNVLKNVNKISTLPTKPIQEFQTPFQDVHDLLEIVKNEEVDEPKIEKTKIKIPLEDSYQFPTLTDEEIKKTLKQKKKMLKALLKADSDVYSYIPSGSFEFSGEIISVQSYYMQRTEVSNLEYRTFLFDLLIQNRKAEFLNAKPDQSMWTKLLGKNSKPMEESYFSDDAFNAYPVNNISREGAELYCKWLYAELQKFAGEKMISFADIRIPTRQEWVKAASVNGQFTNYPWKGNSIKNEKNCYLANHKPTDSTYHDDGGFYTTKVNTYVTNDFGLYNMSGNVAEMVVNIYSNPKGIGIQQPKIETIHGTAGGGWMNKADEVKISAPDNHPNETNPHPNIGFRVVMTHLGRASNVR